jgi:hypothetical protein
MPNPIAAADGDGPPQNPAWLTCPNEPRCPHMGLLHDINDYDDPAPMCCVEGCACGKSPALPEGA